MKCDVVTLISGILNELGLSKIMDKDLSNHSTITLTMKDDLPAINIRSENDEVWIWAVLCDFNFSTLSYYSADLFPLMFNYNEDVFYCGQPCLYPIDGNLDLRAQIRDKHLESSSTFMAVLEEFLNLMQKYRAVLK